MGKTKELSRDIRDNGKSFEKLIRDYICSVLPASLDPLQFAYRSNRSTDNASAFTLHTALSHLENKNTYVRMLFVDYSSAFNTIVNFTRNRLRLGSRHQELPHTDVSNNLATVVVFLLLSHSGTTDNVRGVLPGLRRRRTGLLSNGPKSSFQMRASFVFHLETKVLESGGRVEKLIAQVA